MECYLILSEFIHKKKISAKDEKITKISEKQQSPLDKKSAKQSKDAMLQQRTPTDNIGQTAILKCLRNKHKGGI